MKRVAVAGPLAVFVLLPLGCADAKRTAAPAGRSQVWEYKVVQLGKNEERDLTTLLNVYAKDGWEFNGQITTEERYIVFKRSVRSDVSRATVKATEVRVSETRAVPVRKTTEIRKETRVAPKTAVERDDPNQNRPPE